MYKVINIDSGYIYKEKTMKFKPSLFNIKENKIYSNIIVINTIKENKKINKNIKIKKILHCINENNNYYNKKMNTKYIYYLCYLIQMIIFLLICIRITLY